MKIEHLVNLSLMECFTSCVMTYVKSTGNDPSCLLLDYWNLSYQHRTLLTSKHARLLPLEYLYGMNWTDNSGDSSSLLQCVKEGNAAILLCTASRLSYFPPQYLTMESGGFQHSTLIYGWDDGQGRFLVADPIVNHLAVVSPEEIQYAGEQRKGSGELLYFRLSEPSPAFVQPDARSVLPYCAGRNLSFYLNRDEPGKEAADPQISREQDKRTAWAQWFVNRHNGARAFAGFEADLQASIEWPQDKRNAWISSNKIMIPAIKRIRSLIWNAYAGKAQFPEAVQSAGKQQIAHIHALWNGLLMLLLKYSNQTSGASLVPSLLRQSEKIMHAETGFLEWLRAAVNEEEQNERHLG